MIELLSPAEMARADAAAIAEGVPGINLMEAAGSAVAGAALDLSQGREVLVVAGGGNNGGDGFVAARHLAATGRSVTVAIWGDPDRLRGDAAIAFRRWRGPVVRATGMLPPARLIIDALFGAGLDRPVTGEPSEIVAAMNGHGAPILAVDVPSGLDGATGRADGAVVQAHTTVTFFRKKPGHLLQPGRRLCGKVRLAQIGIPGSVLPAIAPQAFENAPAVWADDFPRPSELQHKYTRGHTVVVSGGMSRTGAARLAARAALRTGSGLVSLASPPDALAVNAAHLTAIMLRRVDDAEALTTLLKDCRFTAIALGPGLGLAEAQQALVLAALACPQPTVLDADALTAFAEAPDRLFAAIARAPTAVVLTPHEGEFARLFPTLAEGTKLARAAAAARQSGAVLILKGPDTVIAAPDGRAAINTNAPPWLATAGSGDVLTGIVAGLLAQGVPAWQAACAAVWLHGAAGTEAGAGLTAEDLDAALRSVIRRQVTP
jgi:ADP-dependent NAD(P)H-hydrate dehydratase / NAD(P)H-hydrate epimerase